MWMKHDQNKEKTTGSRNDSGLLLCPMCKGRGYFEPTNVVPNKLNTETEPKTNPAGFKLPNLPTKDNAQQRIKFRYNHTLPSINVEKRPVGEPTGGFKTYLEVPAKDRRSHNGRGTPPQAKSWVKSETSLASSNDSMCDNLIPAPKTPQNPSETLKTSITNLKTSNWNEAVSALKEIVQISRFYPRLLDPSMVVVYRGLISLLKSFRSVVVRIACQATNELFATMANTQRPEFDELVGVLLLKTADSNKTVRQDANEALDTMVVNIPPVHSVRTITGKGTNHKNPTVRSAAARLLVCMVGVVGVDPIYAGSKEMRARIINSAATFMQDGCQEARNYGKRLMKMLMEHEDFENVLQAEVNDVLLRRIEKSVITMKYKS